MSTEKPRIAIIVGSTRPGRHGSAVGAWVAEQAAGRDDATFELVELAEQNLQLLDEETVPGAADRQYERETTRAWGAKVDGFDGFVWVTPEYNHGVPAAFKNAFDVLYPEWNHKAVTFVGYGAAGGVRAVEQWRQITANAHLHSTRAQLELSLFLDWSDAGFTPGERRPDELDTALDELVALTKAVAVLRG